MIKEKNKKMGNKILKFENFSSIKKLVKFINDNNIKQKDIQKITETIGRNLFYWEDK